MKVDRAAIVIVNYRSQEMVCRCIGSLKTYIASPVDIIVVDNSDVPEGDSILSQYNDIELITADANNGFAAGCNLGIKRALEKAVDYILLLNPDTRVESDFLRVMIDVLVRYPSIGLLGPTILHDSPRRELWNGGGILNWYAGGTRKIIDTHKKCRDVYDVSFLSGCALLLRSEAVRVVGPLAEEFFLYFEDTDYVQRFLKTGYRVAYVPRAEVLHDGSKTVGLHSERYVYYFSRNRIWFMRRWAKWYHYLIFMLYNTLVKLPGAIVVFGWRQHNMPLVKAYFKGYRDGVRRMEDL